MDMQRYKFDNWVYTYDLERTGRYGIPVIQPNVVNLSDYTWTDFRQIGFHRRHGEDLKKIGAHFFIQDYRFYSVYSQLTRYADMLCKLGVVCSPDFSEYTDYPDALNIWSHYRKHAVAAFWQRNGVNVIPTICWTDPSSFEWCFDGEPEESTVAIAFMMSENQKQERANFKAGFSEMMRRLRPKQILWYGRRFEDCDGPIFEIPTFCDQRWRKKESEHTEIEAFTAQQKSLKDVD